MTLTTSIAIAMSLLVPDAKGTKAYVPMSSGESAAIVARCSRTSAPIRCAALLATLSFRESGNNFAAVHDGGNGCGAFGALCIYPHATWDEQVSTAWTLVVDSAATCMEPLAKYTSGSCSRGLAVAREYMAIARKIATVYEDAH